MSNEIVGRFAPSPSGYLHVGNLLAMLLAWLDVRSQGGTMIFRMEDLDPARSKPEYIEAMADDFHWFGLDWDIGWPDPDYRQSRRSHIYQNAFDRLLQEDLIYPCWCTRADRLAAASAPAQDEQVHDSSCRCARLTPDQRAEKSLYGRAPAWKLRSPAQLGCVYDGHYGQIDAHPQDYIVRRADGVFAYQLAVCEDDRLMGVNRVVRGRDLLDCSPQQARLTELLGGTAPSYCHTPLLADGEHKLSKRRGSLSTLELRRSVSPQKLAGALAFSCGLLPEFCEITPTDLIPLFSWDKVCKEDIPLCRLTALL